MDEKIRELKARRAELLEGGGPERVADQHEAGKLSARERVDLLPDPSSYLEIYLFALFAQHRATFFGMNGRQLAADGVVTGAGAIDGRLVHLANCAHPACRDYLRRYIEQARPGHLRHDLFKCFELHHNLQEYGSMLPGVEDLRD